MIRVAVIGFGYWGPNLARCLRETPGVQLKVIADENPARLQAAHHRYPDVELTARAMDAVYNPMVDAVVIATPLATHYEIGIAALAASKHVLMTKPLAASVREAESLAVTAEKRGAVLMVDQTFIYSGAVREMKRIITAGELGDVWYFDSVRVNLGLFQHDADVIWDLAPHDLSILTHLLGRLPTHVSAVGASHVRAGQADMAYLTCWYDDELIAHSHVNWLSPVKVRRVLIGGSRRMLLYDDLEPSETLRVYDKGASVSSQEALYRALVEYRVGACVAPLLDGTEPLMAVCAHFADCVRDRLVPITDGRDGLQVVRLLEAASRSLGQGGSRVAV